MKATVVASPVQATHLRSVHFEPSYRVSVEVDGRPATDVHPLGRQGAHDFVSGCRAGLEAAGYEVEVRWT